MRERTITCKIERVDVGDNGTVLYVSGHIQLDHFSMIEELLRRENGSVTLNLPEVTDRAAVAFLAVCVRNGIELRNCPAFIPEWVPRHSSGNAMRRDLMITEISLPRRRDDGRTTASSRFKRSNH
jgi:hypothetical protein